MSELNISMLDDIIIPDEAEAIDPVELVDTDPTVDPVPEPVEPEPDPEIDFSLKGMKADPIDAELDDGNTEVYSTLAEALKEEGFFQGDEDIADIKNIETLAQAFKKEMKNNEFSDLTDNQKRVLDGFRNGIPEADIIQHEKTVQQYNSITEELLGGNVELQKAVFITDLTAKGISESRAEKMYEISLDSGDLLDEAKQSLVSLKEVEARSYAQRMDAVKVEKDKQSKIAADNKKAIKDSIYQVDKFLGEISVTQNLKEKVHNTMTDVVAYTQDGHPINALMKARQDDPLEFETNLYYLFALTDGFKNVKKFSRQADSKAAKKLESLINNNTFIKDSNVPAYKQDPESYDASGIVELI